MVTIEFSNEIDQHFYTIKARRRRKIQETKGSKSGRIRIRKQDRYTHTKLAISSDQTFSMIIIQYHGEKTTKKKEKKKVMTKLVKHILKENNIKSRYLLK